MFVNEFVQSPLEVSLSLFNPFDINKFPIANPLEIPRNSRIKSLGILPTNLNNDLFNQSQNKTLENPHSPVSNNRQALINSRAELLGSSSVTIKRSIDQRSVKNNHQIEEDTLIGTSSQIGDSLTSDSLFQNQVVTSSAAVDSRTVSSVAIGGGGFVTGITIHPQNGNLVYARTDVGGAFRWDATSQQWRQLVREMGNLSVESLAIAPSDVNTIYIATGNSVSTPGQILKSVDQGESWQILPLTVPIHGNGDWRWTGERLAVDPHDSNVVYFGSRNQGLWQSQNGGNSWSQINTNVLPVGQAFSSNAPAGVTFVEFDPTSSILNGKTQGIYVGVAGQGIYHSVNGGATWAALPVNPVTGLVPQQGEVTGDGSLVVTFYHPTSNQGGVWKWQQGTWRNVTPSSSKNYAGLTVSTGNPNLLYTMTYPMTPTDIYRSTDGGNSWTPLNATPQGLSWYPTWSFSTLSGDLAINPQDYGQVWLSNGFGVWQTQQGNANNQTWQARVQGIEQTVTFDAVSTPGGASLITAIADFDGFRHTNINTIPMRTHGNGQFSTTTSIAYSNQNPNFLVSVGASHHAPWEYRSGFSTDNGVTWQPFASISNGTHPGELNFGNVAVSSTNTNNIIWQPSNWSVPYYTLDQGRTWIPINYFRTSLGGGAHTHLWNRQDVLAADAVNGSTFYIYQHTGGQLVRTVDGGRTWTIANSRSLLPAGVWSGANLKTNPYLGGDVWVSLKDKGLYRSRNSGSSFSKIAGVENAQAFGFGKAAPRTTTPTVFVQGRVNGQEGVFASTNLGQTWQRMASLPSKFLDEIRTITGDMNTYGRVYLGTSGNGFIYGDL